MRSWFAWSAAWFAMMIIWLSVVWLIESSGDVPACCAESTRASNPTGRRIEWRRSRGADRGSGQRAIGLQREEPIFEADRAEDRLEIAAMALMHLGARAALVPGAREPPGLLDRNDGAARRAMPRRPGVDVLGTGKNRVVAWV